MKIANKMIAIIVIVIVLLIGFVGCGIYFFYSLFHTPTYSSTDNKNDAEVASYLTDYMMEHYNVEVTLEQTDKTLETFCRFPIDGCSGKINNDDIYVYSFRGYDEDGKEFAMRYTNSYKKGKEKVDSIVKENYVLYKEFDQIEELIKNYTDTYYVKHDIESKNDIYDDLEYRNNLIIIAYTPKFDINEISKLYKDTNITRNYKLIITNKMDFYQEAINSKENNFSIASVWEGNGNIVQKENEQSIKKVPFNEVKGLSNDKFYYVAFYLGEFHDDLTNYSLYDIS